MIRRTLLRATAVLAAASLLGVAHASTGNTLRCESGRTLGQWDLPTRGSTGSMSGVLEHDGRPRFRVRAVLEPGARPSSTAPAGTIEGVLEVITRTGTRPFARVSGQWKLDARGQGVFRASLWRPGPTPTAPARLLGGMEGRFQDTPTTTGRYAGRWKLCR